MQCMEALDAIGAILPTELRDRLRELRPERQKLVEEFRLRRNYPLSALFPEGEQTLGGRPVTEQDLHEVLERASQASAHTVLEQMRNGFVTLRGGHRIGLCGTVSRKDGQIVSLRYLSSLSVRIARAAADCGVKLLPELTENGAFVNTLVLGPPGSGKTTLLRDLIRLISDGQGTEPQRVGVADERGELAALWHGEPQFYIGSRTDVLDGCSKAEGLSILLRGMNPQVLVVDEITRNEDAAAILEAAGCGAALLASAHGSSLKDLERRPVYRRLMEEGVFRRVVLLQTANGQRSTRVEVLL